MHPHDRSTEGHETDAKVGASRNDDRPSWRIACRISTTTTGAIPASTDWNLGRVPYSS